MSVASDKSELPRHHDALHEAERRLQDVVKASQGGLGTFEFELGDDGTLEFVACTPAGARLLQFEGAPPFGRPIEALFPGLADTDVLQAMREVAGQGGTVERNHVVSVRGQPKRAYMFFGFQIGPGRIALKVADSTQVFVAESERRLSERMFAVAFNESPEAISLTRLRDGLIVDVNQEFLNVTGYSRAELLGRTVVARGFWSDNMVREALVAPLIARGRVRDQESPMTIQGQRQHLFRFNGSLIDVEGEPHILMYLKDITAERQAQQDQRRGESALYAANEKLSQQVQLFELTEGIARVGHWIASEDGQHVHWSQGLSDIAGIKPELYMPLAVARKGLYEEDAHIFHEARQRMDGAMVEYRWRHANGSVLWLRSRMRRQHRIDGTMVDFGVVQDITAEREVTAVLSERLAFIQKITSRVPGMVFQFTVRPDGSSGLAFVSDPVKDIFGITPEEARDHSGRIISAIHVDDRAAMIESIQQALHDMTPWSHEFRVICADGVTRWYWGNAVPEREADGTVLAYGSLTDINDRKYAQAALTLTRVGVERTSDAMLWITPDARIVDVNEASCVSLGYSREELLRMSISDINGKYDRVTWDGHFAELRDKGSLTFETQHCTKSGKLFPVEVVANFVRFGDQELNCAFVRDITQRKRNEAEIQRLAYYDGLTGLPNRSLLLDRLNKALVQSRRRPGQGALLFIDLDNFKDLNDSSGHDVGDELLQQVSRRLATCVREGDTVARFGGDEFVVMLEGLSGLPEEAVVQVEGVAEKILASLNQVYTLQDKQHYSTPSIGVTMFSDTSTSVDELLKRADLAMYEAKAAGRNTVRFFDPQMQAVVATRIALESDLRQGLQRDELLLHYQPVVDAGGNVLGAEALVRWQHPTHGLISPESFIPMAEQSGLIEPLGQRVLWMACRQLALWASEPERAGLFIAVNVSARQFRHPDFVLQVITILDQTGANPHLLKLELTESMLLNDVEDAIRKMGELRVLGFSFSLDDFGTGYSSLGYLKRLPLEQLKIDQSFVRDVLSDPNDAAIVQTILALGKSLGFTVVAEGVETCEQRDYLLRHGCEVFQGYLFGRPAPVQDLLQGPLFVA